MDEPSTDHGTVLPPDASALVVDGSGDISLMLADYPDGVEVPRFVLLLGAVLVRSQDEERIDEMLTDLEETPRS